MCISTGRSTGIDGYIYICIFIYLYAYIARYRYRYRLVYSSIIKSRAVQVCLGLKNWNWNMALGHITLVGEPWSSKQGLT